MPAAMELFWADTDFLLGERRSASVTSTRSQRSISLGNLLENMLNGRRRAYLAERRERICRITASSLRIFSRFCEGEFPQSSGRLDTSPICRKWCDLLIRRMRHD